MPAIFLHRSASSASCGLSVCGAQTQGPLVSHGVAAIPSPAICTSGKPGKSSEPDQSYTAVLHLKYRNEKGLRERHTFLCTSRGPSHGTNRHQGEGQQKGKPFQGFSGCWKITKLEGKQQIYVRNSHRDTEGVNTSGMGSLRSHQRQDSEGGVVLITHPAFIPLSLAACSCPFDMTLGQGFGPLKKALRKFLNLNVMGWMVLQLLIHRHTNRNCPFPSCYCQQSGASTKTGMEKKPQKENVIEDKNFIRAGDDKTLL